MGQAPQVGNLEMSLPKAPSLGYTENEVSK